MIQTPQSQDETRSLSDCRTRPHFALVRLHDLIDNREAEAGSSFKIRLKGLKKFFCLLRIEAWTGVGETHLPVGATFGHSDCENSSIFLHGAHSVFAEVPEDLFEFVSIGQDPCFGLRKTADESHAGILGGKAMFEQSQCVF
jgi:hypothetical protein